MSLASDLLHSTSKRRGLEGQPDLIGESQERLLRLNQVVYGLLSEHEPSGNLEARLRADLKIMSLSGLASENNLAKTSAICRQAAQIMAELNRLLPRCRGD
jgi:hypothetical protein